MIRSASMDSSRARRRRLALVGLGTLLGLAALVPAARADNTWAVHQTLVNKSDFQLRRISLSLIDNTSHWRTQPAPVIAAKTGSNTSYFTNAWERKRSRQIEATVRYAVYQGTAKIGEVSVQSGVVCTAVTVTGHCSDYHRYESADTTGAPKVQASWTDDAGSPENFNTTITFGNAPPPQALRGAALRIDTSRVRVTGPLARVRVRCVSAHGARCIGRLAVRKVTAGHGGSELGWQGYSVRANRSAVIYLPIGVAAANQIARRGGGKGLVVARSDDGRRVTRAVVLG